MKLANTRPMNTRRDRRELDRARNPRLVAHHACERFIEDSVALKLGGPGTPAAAEQCIRLICQKASEIRACRDCRVLISGDWFIFYRDETVITVMHKDSKRRWPAT